MPALSNIDSTTWMVLLTAAIIIALALFAKFIKVVLKIVIIAVMLGFILYFLRQAGIF